MVLRFSLPACFLWAAPLGVAALLAGCTLTPSRSASPIARAVEIEPWADPDRVLVTVNGRAITRGEFYRRILDRLGTVEILSGIIKDELIRQEAERRGIRVSDAEAQREAHEVLDDFAERMGGRTKLAALYAEQGISMADLHGELVRKKKAELIAVKVVVAMRKLDDEALRKYYKQTYGNKRYVTRHIAYGFRPPPDRPDISADRLKKQAYLKALQAVERLRQGADFATLARTESEDQVTRETGGRLGEINEFWPMPAVLKEAIFALSEGETSQPVENPQGGYHIFQVTEILAPESFSDCVEKIKRELMDRQPTPDEIQKVLIELRQRATIRPNPELVGALER